MVNLLHVQHYCRFYRLGQLKNLRQLMICDNKFEELPEVVYEMSELQELRISDCCLSNLDHR